MGPVGAKYGPFQRGPGTHDVTVIYETKPVSLIDMVSYHHKVAKMTPYANGMALHNSEFNYGLSGHVTVGSFEQIKCALGDYAFDVEGARLDADVVQYSTAAVTSITVISDGIEYAPIRGDIKIVAGQNISIQEEHHGDGHTILHIHRRINPDLDTPQCIKTINAVRPDTDGNIALVSRSECLEVTEENAQIVISETCCDPCCGCEELSSIEQSIQNIIQANTEIRLNQQKLEEQLRHLQIAMSITGV